jgi:hypothetical protein
MIFITFVDVPSRDIIHSALHTDTSGKYRILQLMAPLLILPL